MLRRKPKADQCPGCHFDYAHGLSPRAIEAIARRAALDDKYIGMINDTLRWYSQDRLGPEGAQSSVRLAMVAWADDRRMAGENHA